MKIVLDTNVFVSSVLTQSGNPFTIMEACRRGKLELIISKPLLDEIGRVFHKPKLKRRHKWDDKQISRYLSRLVELSENVLIENVPDLPADPTDAIILATAKKAQADAIVTGDEKHLLPLKSYKNIPIITPRQCVEQYLAKKAA